MHRNCNVDPIQYMDKDQSIFLSPYVSEPEAVEMAMEGQEDVLQHLSLTPSLPVQPIE